MQSTKEWIAANADPDPELFAWRLDAHITSLVDQARSTTSRNYFLRDLMLVIGIGGVVVCSAILLFRLTMNTEERHAWTKREQELVQQANTCKDQQLLLDAYTKKVTDALTK